LSSTNQLGREGLDEASLDFACFGTTIYLRWCKRLQPMFCKIHYEACFGKLWRMDRI